MSNRCDICNKKKGTGNSVSHSNRKTKRKFLPNLQKTSLFDSQTGEIWKGKFCTRCIRTHAKTM